MSALPKAVKKQIEEANRLHEELKNSSATPPAEQPPTDQGTPQEAPTAAPPAGEQPAAQAPPPAPASEGWEQKYRVLQGKYNAEVPRMQRQLQEQSALTQQLQQQLTATQTMLASLHRQQGAAPASAEAAPASASRLVKDEEVQTFGEDLTDFIRRVAQDSVLPAVEKKLQPVQQQVEQVRSVANQVVERSAKTEQEKMFELLDRELPDWRRQNNDEGFLSWLDQQDPYSGEQRMSLLRRAYERFDAPRVITFFKGYRNEHAVVTPPAEAAAPTQAAPQRRLEDFVAPGSAKAGTTDAQNGAGKRIWTQAEIGQFYNDRRAGKYRNSLERAAELERDIVAAGREGRVR